jgi:hypothetical protein
MKKRSRGVHESGDVSGRESEKCTDRQRQGLWTGWTSLALKAHTPFPV